MRRDISVLLVEDVDVTRRLWRHWAESDGKITVLEAGSAAEAERVAGQPDCVVLDLELPDGRGLELYQRVRLRFPNSAIVICSGQDWGSSLEGPLLDAGADDYLSKLPDTTGVNRELFVRSIRHAVIRHKARIHADKIEDAAAKASETIQQIADLAGSKK